MGFEGGFIGVEGGDVGVVELPRRSSRTNLKRERKQVQTMYQPVENVL